MLTTAERHFLTIEREVLALCLQKVPRLYRRNLKKNQHRSSHFKVADESYKSPTGRQAGWPLPFQHYKLNIKYASGKYYSKWVISKNQYADETVKSIIDSLESNTNHEEVKRHIPSGNIY